MPSLIVISGEQVGKCFQLAKRTLTGGRDPAREIQLIDVKVSRKHFQVRFENGRHILIELKSLNGVIVNGARVQSEHELGDGDRIQVGNTVLEYRLQEHQDRTDAVQQYRRAERGLREDRTFPE